ncbi:MAG: hypothetical protein ABGX31_01150 [bacterium]
MSQAADSNPQRIASLFFALLTCFTLVATSCNSPKQTHSPSTIKGIGTPTQTITRLPKEPLEDPPKPQSTFTSNSKAEKPISHYAALIFLSLLSERNTDPTIDPVTKICQGPMWLKLDENFSNSMGSSDSYITTINETKFIVGGSGTSDAFSVVISTSGERDEILNTLRTMLKIEGPIAEEPGIGDVMRLYKASANNRTLGLISFIEAADKSNAIGDLITLSFLSKSKLVSENLWDGMTKKR